MSYLRKVSFYDNFKCTASKCSDSCCIGWEIDIDEDTLGFYKSVKGEFGKRLNENIQDADNNENPHFITKANGRCPFLNECNLCDIYTELGEEHLSQICDDHPRFYQWYVEGEEAGLGLCCEEAARLLLEKEINTIEDIYVTKITNEEKQLDEDEIFMKSLEEVLFDIRNEIFNMIISENDIETLENRLVNNIPIWENKYDKFLSGFEDEIDYNEVKFWDDFWEIDNLENAIKLYSSLEINDSKWLEKINRMDIAKIIIKKRDFLLNNKSFQYKNILIYFIYRHFMNARFDDFLKERIIFSIISTNVILALGVDKWEKTGEFTDLDQINICKMYSREIEYNLDNLEKLENYKWLK